MLMILSSVMLVLKVLTTCFELLINQMLTGSAVTVSIFKKTSFGFQFFKTQKPPFSFGLV